MLPVGLAELPETPADGIEPSRGHVDRTESPVRREVRRAKLGRPPAGQGLALVTAGEESELFRIIAADTTKPFARNRECLIPFDLLGLGIAALTDPQQRLAKAGG